MGNNRRWSWILGLVVVFPLLSLGQASTVSGTFTVEPATLVSLGFEWHLTGDDNRNAAVKVSYRKVGETQWHDALPLMRLQDEQIGVRPAPSHPNADNQPRFGGESIFNYPVFKYVAANMFAGSVLNLEPGTKYECHFVLTDPDGVTGKTVQDVTVTTRKAPESATGGHVYNVYPVGWTGPKQEPAFTGLMAAYYMRGVSFDYENAYPPRVQPGDTILIHAGLYVGDRFHYMNGAPRPGYLALGDLFDGTYYLTASGTPDKPIVIKGAGDGEAIFDGAGCEYLFNLMGANYNYFENITIRNAGVAFLLGIKGIAGSSGFTLTRSRIYDVGRGVQDDWSGSKNFYIADNVLIGRHDPGKMMSWNGAAWAKYPGYPEMISGATGSEYAIKLYGQGHVVAYNYLANWHDGVDVATYGTPDGAPNDIPDRVPLAIDFYNNDLYNMGDNCIETDGSARNVRVFRNRCFNSGSGAFSVQPVFGGPVYFYQNLLYNSPVSGALKYIEESAGVLTYNNTFIADAHAGPASNETFRNNLILSPGGCNPVFSITATYTNYTSSDYNGYLPAMCGPYQFEWNSPPFNEVVDYAHEPVTRQFKSLAEYQQATGQEKRSVLVGYGVFMNVTPPNSQDLQHLYSPEDYDFRLKPGSAATGVGMVLPTITDGFQGKAPDLGAYQVGIPIPHYGPRESVSGSVPLDSAQFRSWRGYPGTDE